MKKSEIIRAWKDEEFAATLSADQRLELPASPAGLNELDADELRSVAGAWWESCRRPCLCEFTSCP